MTKGHYANIGAIVGGVSTKLLGSIAPAMMQQVMLAEAEKVLRAFIEDRGRMSEENMRAFLALHNSHLHDGSGPIMGVVRTNGFYLGEALRDKGMCFSLCYLSVRSPYIFHRNVVRQRWTNRRVWRSVEEHVPYQSQVESFEATQPLSTE